MRIEKSKTMCDEMREKVIIIHHNKSEFPKRKKDYLVSVVY